MQVWQVEVVGAFDWQLDSMLWGITSPAAPWDRPAHFLVNSSWTTTGSAACTDEVPTASDSAEAASAATQDLATASTVLPVAPRRVRWLASLAVAWHAKVHLLAGRGLLTCNHHCNQSCE